MAGSQREAATADYLTAHLKDMAVPGGRCNFAPHDDAEDARIKESIRLYVETWMLPYAEALAASLKGEASREQAETLDNVKSRGY